MKKIILFTGMLFSFGLYAEIWEKPKYTPDEGHLQEEIERQEERPEAEKNKDKKHQDETPQSNPGFELTDDEMSEDEEATN